MELVKNHSHTGLIFYSWSCRGKKSRGQHFPTAVISMQISIAGLSPGCVLILGRRQLRHIDESGCNISTKFFKVTLLESKTCENLFTYFVSIFFFLIKETRLNVKGTITHDLQHTHLMPHACMTERTSCSRSNYHPLTGPRSFSWITDLIAVELRIMHITKSWLTQMKWVGKNNHISRLRVVVNGYIHCVAKSIWTMHLCFSWLGSRSFVPIMQIITLQHTRIQCVLD